LAVSRISSASTVSSKRRSIGCTVIDEEAGPKASGPSARGTRNRVELHQLFVVRQVRVDDLLAAFAVGVTLEAGELVVVDSDGRVGGLRGRAAVGVVVAAVVEYEGGRPRASWVSGSSR
jgi:hypothetical protein